MDLLISPPGLLHIPAQHPFLQVVRKIKTSRVGVRGENLNHSLNRLNSILDQLTFDLFPEDILKKLPQGPAMLLVLSS